MWTITFMTTLALATVGADSVPVAGAGTEPSSPLPATAPGPDSIGGIPAEVLQRPIPLRDRLTRVNHPVATDDPEARSYHEQGLTYLHLFGYIEAARSFHAALERDPELAPARLGLAMAYQSLSDLDAAQEAADRAVERAADAPAQDRAFVELLARTILERDAVRGDEDERDRLLEEMEAAIQEHSEATELRVFRARFLSGSEEREALREVLVDAPNHVGIHHYLVHRFERSPETVDLAVAHGSNLSALAPASAHGRHMYGHNLRKVGRADEAIREFEAADSIERHLDREEGIPLEHDWHHPHNLALLAMSYLHQGRMEEADAAFRDLASLPTSSSRRALGFLATRAEFHLASSQWDAALEVSRELGEAEDDDARAAAQLVEAMAQAGRGDLEAATSIRRKIEEEGRGSGVLANFHQDALALFGDAEEAPALDPGGNDGDAPAAMDRDDLDDILDQLMGRQGPDSWSRSHVHMEILARLAHAHGDAGAVERIADAMRQHDEAYAGGYYWQARASRLRGVTPNPATVNRALTLWGNADPDLPERESLEEWALAAGQDEATAPPANDPQGLPVARAARVDGPVTMDGTLEDPAWGEALPVGGLLQVEPEEGAPATEPTEVHLLHDGENLYVGARLHDSRAPRTRLGRRDAVLQDSDWFAVMLDANRDEMTAYRFRVNPSGVRGEAMLARNGTADDSWEPVWEAETSVDEEGWTATMRIPLNQLRFDEDAGELWGLQLERTLRRNDETAVFSFTPRRDAAGIPRYGLLEGMDGTDPGRQLEAMPYVTARAERSPLETEGTAASSSHGDMGVNLRYRLSSAFTLDAAANPDFGQVEADPAAISLNTFERRFPENRPFFVEGADLFRFNPGMITPDLFYSRRVGAAPQGHLPAGAVTEQGLDAVPILGASKITGRTSDGWSLGFLGAYTDRESAPFTDQEGNQGTALVEPRTTYLAGRARRELREGGTTVGAMGTAVRRGDTSPEELQHLNDAGYAAGADVRHELRDRRWRVQGAFQTSRVEGRSNAMTTLQRASLRYFQRPDADHLDLDPERTSLRGWAGHASIHRQAGEHWRGGVQVEAVSPEHEVNDLGFQNQADRISVMGDLAYRQDEPGDRFHRWRAFAQTGMQRNFGGDRVMAGFMAGFNGTLQNRWGFRVQANHWPSVLDDRTTRGGPLIRTPDESAVMARVHSDTRRSLVVEAMGNYRRATDGGGGSMLRGSLALRPASHWSLTLSPRFIRNTSPVQYLGATDDPAAEETFGTRYLFGNVDQRTLELGAQLDVALQPGLTVEFHGQGYVTGGRFDEPGELRRPRGRDIARYGRDVGEVEETEDGLRVDPAPESEIGGEPFVLPDRDFTFRSLRGSAVLRWEWRQGSTLHLVWQQDRSARLDEADFRLGRGLTRITDAAGHNTLQLKVSYWLTPF